MAQVLQTEIRRAAVRGSQLERLLAEGRAFSAEFPDYLANHLPMILVALHRLGASDARLAEYFTWYRDENRLQPLPPPVAPIQADRWTQALGDRRRESDYRAFFSGEVDRLGARGAIAAYLPALVPGLAASATHGLMRLAYGVMREDDAEIATALGYWAATYLELGLASGAAATSADPGEVLLRMRAFACYRNVETERDLLWHFMRAVSAKPEFGPVVDWLEIGPGHVSTGARRFAGAFCRNHGFLRAACAHRLPLAASAAAGASQSRSGAALFLAGDRLALSKDRLSRSADAGNAWRNGATRRVRTGRRSPPPPLAQTMSTTSPLLSPPARSGMSTAIGSTRWLRRAGCSLIP